MVNGFGWLYGTRKTLVLVLRQGLVYSSIHYAAEDELKFSLPASIHRGLGFQVQVITLSQESSVAKPQRKTT